MQDDIDRAQQAVRIAARLDWTWSLDDIERFSAATGWNVTRRSQFGAGLATSFVVRRSEAGFSIRGEVINAISFTVVDTAVRDGSAAPEVVLDSFAELGGRMVTELGEPSRRRPGVEPWIRWDLANLVVFLDATDALVVVRLVSPDYQRKQDHIDEVVIPWMAANPLDEDQ
ncbi:DUF6301 family protein [Nocardia sp. R16R-3T]